MHGFTVPGLTAIINQLLPEPHAGLLVGLLFGSTRQFSKELYQDLVTTGTIHIAALSGQNLSILSRLFSERIVRWAGKRNASLGTMLLVWMFVWFVGPSATIVRAAIMATLSLGAVVLGRQYWSLYSWICTVMVMLVFRPAWATDVSFQLSAMATLGILLFGGKGFGGNMLVSDLRLTLSAQLFTAPLIYYYFHRTSLIAPLANIAISWIVGPLTGLGWVTVMVAWVWIPAGKIVASLDWIFLEYIVRTVHMFSKVPFASI